MFRKAKPISRGRFTLSALMLFVAGAAIVLAVLKPWLQTTDVSVRLEPTGTIILDSQSLTIAAASDMLQRRAARLESHGRDACLHIEVARNVAPENIRRLIDTGQDAGFRRFSIRWRGL